MRWTRMFAQLLGGAGSEVGRGDDAALETAISIGAMIRSAEQAVQGLPEAERLPALQIILRDAMRDGDARTAAMAAAGIASRTPF